MNREQLFAVMRPIIMQVTGVPECILADPNARAPSGEYCSVEPEASVTERGQAFIRRNVGATTDDVNTVVATQIITQCEINFYRGDARSRAKRLMNANKIPSASAMLRAGNVGWNRCGPIHNLTALQADQREQRANVSIYLRYELTTDMDVSNAISSASWNVTNDDGRVLRVGEVRPIPTSALLFNAMYMMYNQDQLTTS